MIEKLRGMAIFSTVVDQGTFRAAAQHLGLSPSWISEAVSELEKDLGVTLLHRSTRHLSLTPEGDLFYRQTKMMLSAAEKGLDVINPFSNEPTGLLRLTMPAFVTQTDLMDLIEEFSTTYPNIELNLDFSDQPRGLIKDGFDLGIRVGWLKDSELLTRNVGQAERWLIAGPGYVADRTLPAHPTDLEDWDWIRFVVRSDQLELTAPDGRKVGVTGRSKITVNSADAVYQLALRGFGVTPLPAKLAQTGIENGDLVRLLPDWSLPALGLHAVWPSQGRREKLTLMFVRFLSDADKRAKRPTSHIM